MMKGITRLGEFWRNIRDKKEAAKASKGIKSINTIKLMLSVAVGICCVGVGSGNGYAISGGTAGDTKYVNTTSSSPKGIHNIGNPSYNANGSTYNYIYYGCESTPIYWRVLNTTSNGYDMNVGTSATEGLLVLKEYYLEKKMG